MLKASIGDEEIQKLVEPLQKNVRYCVAKAGEISLTCPRGLTGAFIRIDRGLFNTGPMNHGE